jgi:YidC/Oxa1 family membrane protein insertase
VLGVDIDVDGNPIARVTKTYTLRRQTKEELTYDLGLSVNVDNLTDEPIDVIVTQQGSIGLRREGLRAEDRMVLAAIWEGDTLEVNQYARAKVRKQGKLELGTDKENTRIAWAGEANQYFACLMAPVGRKGPADPPRFAALDAMTLTDMEEGAGADLTLRYVTRPISIPAKLATSVAFDCYIGPKSKRAFQTVPEYLSRDYYQAVSISYYICAPNAVVSLMMKLLGTFHDYIWPHNYGVAIIILVLVVRTILHPITKKSQVNMVKMQKNAARLQPKIQAAKEKFANDRAAMNQAVMQIYKEEGVNPAGQMLTCLPMMLQIPIWGGLFTALNFTIEMRHAPFDGWWIKDLAGQDALIHFAHPITIPLIGVLMGGPIHSLNLLPILLGISQILQAKYMPRGNPGVQASGNPDQLEQQRKMMTFMSLFMVMIFYNAPSGLNLYIMASNFFGVLEQWRIRQHLAAQEEKGEPSAPAKPSPGKTPDRKPAAGPREKSWLQKKWDAVQKQVEDAKRVQSPKHKGKPRK